MWKLKAKYHTPMLSVRSMIPVCRSGMLDWRFWILVLPRSSAMVVQIGFSILSMCSFASSLYDIHLHNSMITFLVFVFISWASFFSRFYRDREALSRILLGEVNLESNNSAGRSLGWGGGGY